MFGVTYEHDLLRKYTVIFGALFNDVFLTRLDSASNQIQKLKVPVNYGPKEKFLARVNSNPDGLHDGKPAISLPRMAFQMIDMQYDSSRHLTPTGRISVPDPRYNHFRVSTYNPVAYNIHYRLWIMVKNSVDGTRIIEQILPMFKPQYTVTADLLPTMNLEHDIPITLNGCSVEDDYEGDWTKRRQLIWTLDFTLKGYIYGQTNSTGVIKLAQTAFIANMSMACTQPLAVVSVYPGQTLDGAATTDKTQAIPYSEVNPDEEWAYIVQIDEDE